MPYYGGAVNFKSDRIFYLFCKAIIETDMQPVWYSSKTLVSVHFMHTQSVLLSNHRKKWGKGTDRSASIQRT